MKENGDSAASLPQKRFSPEVYFSVTSLRSKIFTQFEENPVSVVVQAISKRKATVDIDDSPTRRTQILVEWLGEYAVHDDSNHENGKTHEDDRAFEDASSIKDDSTIENTKDKTTAIRSGWDSLPPELRNRVYHHLWRAMPRIKSQRKK